MLKYIIPANVTIITLGFITLTSELLYQMSRGVDHEPVRPRQLPKSVGCGKNFRGKAKLSTQQLASAINVLMLCGIMQYYNILVI